MGKGDEILHIMFQELGNLGGNAQKTSGSFREIGGKNVGLRDIYYRY